MSAKKRTSSGSELVGMDFEPDLTKATGMDLNGLVTVYKGKATESETKKQNLTERISKHRENITRIQNEIVKLQNKVSEFGAALWINEVIRPIAKELEAVFPGMVTMVVGPTGMMSAVTVLVHPADLSEDDKLKGKSCRSVTFLPMPDGAIAVRDYSSNTSEYPEGSIGALNGLNHPIHEMPSDGNIEWIIGWLK